MARYGMAIDTRRCVGCMTSKPKSELVRIAGYQGVVALDPTGRAKGRGVYVCPDGECVRKAQKKNAFRRGLSMDIAPEQMEALIGALKDYENKD